MSLRIVEVLVPRDDADALIESLEEVEHHDLWRDEVGDDHVSVRVLVEAVHSEEILERCESRVKEKGSRVLVFPLEATLPPLPKPDKREEEAEGGKAGKEQKKPPRISRDELLEDLAPGTVITRSFVITVLLSTAIAGIGLVRDDLALIIGAMVIAPLLTPNMALAFATTLGDMEMVRSSLRTATFGFLLAFAMACGLGLVLPVDPEVGAVASRTHAAMSDVALALAAGCAGCLSFTTGVSAALVGVMVAAALLPPTAAAGILVGSGHFALAAGSGLLVATNLICITLAGVGTFVLQGIRPGTWWEADRAKKATRMALLALGVLLAILIALILWSGGIED